MHYFNLIFFFKSILQIKNSFAVILKLMSRVIANKIAVHVKSAYNLLKSERNFKIMEIQLTIHLTIFRGHIFQYKQPALKCIKTLA